MGKGGLEDVLKSAFGGVSRMLTGGNFPQNVRALRFGGVSRMLTGKNFPQNVRALIMLCEEVLREIVEEVETYDELIQTLEKRADQSRTAKFWLNCLIRPVLIMMLFIRTERVWMGATFVL